MPTYVWDVGEWKSEGFSDPPAVAVTATATGTANDATIPSGIGSTLDTADTGPQATPYLSISGAVEIDPGEDLEAAITANAAGTKFYLRAGVHRFTDIRPKDSQEFIGEYGAILRGSRVITSSGWSVYATGIWSLVDATQANPGTEDPWGYESEKNGSAVTIVNANDWTPMQYRDNLYYDQVMLRRRPTLALLTPNSDECFIDYATDTIYLGRNPSGHVVEQAIPGGRCFLADTGVGGDYIKVCNLVIEQYGPSYQEGAIQIVDTGGGYANVDEADNGLDGSDDLMGWEIVECEIRYNHGAGIMVGPGTTVTRCNIQRNGCAGIKAAGRRILYDSCWVHHNNVAHCARWNEAGGGKFWNTQGFVLTNCILEDNYGPGMWLDYIYGVGSTIIGTSSSDQINGAARVAADPPTPTYDTDPFATGVGWRIHHNTSRRNDGPDWSVEMTWGGELDHNECYDSNFGDNPLCGAANWTFGQEVDPKFRAGSIFMFMPGPTWVHHNDIGQGADTIGGVVVQYQWRGTVDPAGPQSVGVINVTSPWGTCQGTVVEENTFRYGPPGYTGFQWAASCQNDVGNGGDHPAGTPFPYDVAGNPIAEQNGIVFQNNTYHADIDRAHDRGTVWGGPPDEALDYQFDVDTGPFAASFYTNGQPGISGTDPFWHFFERRFMGLDDAQDIMGWDVGA